MIAQEVSKQIAAALLEKNTAAPQNTQKSAVATVSYKDEFLGFILRKAEKYSDKTEVAIGKAVDVATEEVPKLFVEYIKWNIIERLSYIGLPVFFLTAFIILLTCNRKNADWCGGEPDNAAAWMTIIGWIGTVVSGIAFIITVIVNTSTILQLMFAPRVFILQQAIELIKRN